MTHVYSPVRNGFVQGAYYDQQGTGLAGSLPFGGGHDYVDAFIVGDEDGNGLGAGLAVIASPARSVQRPGLNSYVVTKPKSTSTAGDIVGVVARNQQMNTNADGKACYFQGDLCSVARTGRYGARIRVQLADHASPVADEKACVIVTGKDAGKFTSGGAAPDVIVMADIQFISSADNTTALVVLL